MNVADLVAGGLLVLTGISGFRRGLVTGVLSLLGLVTGAVLGARVAPAILGDFGGWTALVALGGAAVGGFLGQMFGIFLGKSARRLFLFLPPLRLLDSAGGVLLGAATGLALCWVVGAALLYAPDQNNLRQLAQGSAILSALTDALPPERVIDALDRIDTFATIAGPAAGVGAPDPSIASDPDVLRARGSVVRLRGIACGIGVEGSGWIVRPGLVVTNAHVVAGIDAPVIDRGRGKGKTGAVVAFDAEHDLAIVKVPGLAGRPLQQGSPERGGRGALLGYPLDGPFVLTPVRIGSTARVAARDAYGRLGLGRKVVGFRGGVRTGNSGGPLVDAEGRVVATAFARREGANEGYAASNDALDGVLAGIGTTALHTACVER